MANYKMVNADQLDSDLKSVANTIRSKCETSAQLSFPNGFKSAIESIETGVDTSDATASAGDILSGKTAYVDGEKVTGNIVTVTQATPSISVSSSGLITASATQKDGYVVAGTKSATKKISHTNLVAENIKSGISIFGVTGTMESGATVKAQDGSCNTDKSGCCFFYLNFKPDLLIVYGGCVSAFDNLYECNLTFALNERSSDSSSFTGEQLMSTVIYANGTGVVAYVDMLEENEDSCTLYMQAFYMTDGVLNGDANFANKAVNYRAIKYT